jgi:hypothetical protein
MSARRPMHLLLALLLVASAVALPLANPASANTPPTCGPSRDGEIWTDEWGNQYQCKLIGVLWVWELIVSPNGKKNNRLYTTSSPKSYQYVSVAFRPGSGGGIMEGAQAIYDGSGNRMSRPMRTRLVIKYWHPTGGWLTCHDTGWINNGTRHWSHNGINMGASPDCGGATYGSKVAGLYWSTTLGRWLGGGWLLSGNIGLPPSCCAPVTQPMGDDPLNLPPAP